MYYFFLLILRFVSFINKIDINKILKYIFNKKSNEIFFFIFKKIFCIYKKKTISQFLNKIIFYNKIYYHMICLKI